MTIRTFSYVVFGITLLLILALTAGVYFRILSVSEGSAPDQPPFNVAKNDEERWIALRREALTWVLDSPKRHQRIHRAFLEGEENLFAWMERIETDALLPAINIKKEMESLRLTRMDEERNFWLHLFSLQIEWYEGLLAYLQSDRYDDLERAVSAKRQWIGQLVRFAAGADPPPAWADPQDIRMIHQMATDLERALKEESSLVFLLY